ECIRGCSPPLGISAYRSPEDCPKAHRDKVRKGPVGNASLTSRVSPADSGAAMALEEYQRKRDFRKTPEPAGAPKPRKTTAPAALSFVVQKHAATRLHYDFRLELGGVLLSWAIPKGPSLDPQEKRLAVHVEDHPLDYGGFEGVIPKGQYGGGTVLLWDRGTWAPEGPNPEEAYRKGA